MNTDNAWRSRELTSRGEIETDRLAQAIAEHCVHGSVIGLSGTLGAGKTQFVRSLAVALGIPADDVTSPTFVLCHEYQGRLPLFHYDAYRLQSTDEWLRLGAEEQVGRYGVSVIEWSDRIAQLLPDDRLDIYIEILGETSRKFVITAGGKTAARFLAAVPLSRRR